MIPLRVVYGAASATGTASVGFVVFLIRRRRSGAGGCDDMIDMPGLAMLLTVAREKPWSSFPAGPAPNWYGWSADTHLRGLQKLLELGLVERRTTYKNGPLSPNGYTLVYQDRLVSWMRPSRAKTTKTTPPAAAKSGK
ncbi:hypothetical protein AB0M29_45135 [Streptomyces sp. NPDC051976]|uniref:hypothetical protein n=1 Tax=Streptomyces sp. NPDC051976 TaxID=3154947 RepID=UPI00341A0D33